MNSVRQIRLVTTNFYTLQGLRAVPLGFCLLLVSLWANEVRGPARDFVVPGLGVIGSLILLFAIDRYYLHNFGRVQRTPASSRLEWLASVMGGIFALGALWLDISFKLPVSLLGLVFATGLLADYLRVTWLVKGRFLFYYPLGAILMAGVSVLQLFGFVNWWQAFGLRSQLIGMSTAIGVFTIIAGIWGHISLVHTLPSRMGANSDHSI